MHYPAFDRTPSPVLLAQTCPVLLAPRQQIRRRVHLTTVRREFTHVEGSAGEDARTPEVLSRRTFRGFYLLVRSKRADYSPTWLKSWI
jgi:hypothetical protein